MVVDRFIIKNKQIALSPKITFMPKTAVVLLKTGLVFIV